MWLTAPSVQSSSLWPLAIIVIIVDLIIIVTDWSSSSSWWKDQLTRLLIRFLAFRSMLMWLVGGHYNPSDCYFWMMFLVGNGDDDDDDDDAHDFDKEKVKASLQMVGNTAHHQKKWISIWGTRLLWNHPGINWTKCLTDFWLKTKSSSYLKKRKILFAKSLVNLCCCLSSLPHSICSAILLEPFIVINIINCHHHHHHLQSHHNHHHQCHYHKWCPYHLPQCCQ